MHADSLPRSVYSDFDADSSSCFSFEVQTDEVTDATQFHIYAKVVKYTHPQDHLHWQSDVSMQPDIPFSWTTFQTNLVSRLPHIFFSTSSDLP